MEAQFLNDVAQTVRRALEEDVGEGDITATLVPQALTSQASVISRENAVLCGTAWFNEVFAQLDGRVRANWSVHDGSAIGPGQEICVVTGPASALLTGERTALNFLQSLSGTATLARQYAEAVKGTAAKILDTRKTLPGLRAAQKYAVRCGGCFNHRLGLYDGVLIKENHILSSGSVSSAVNRIKETAPGLPIEVEVESLDELEEALASGADIVMLDNFDLPRIREAVHANGGRARLEISGGVGLDEIRRLAETGVDYISVGALTKHVRAVDFSMRFQPLAGRPESTV